jgi:TolA-binding protein
VAAADARYAEAERAFSRRDDARASELFEAIARDAADPAHRGLAQYRLASIRARQGRLDEAERLFAAIEDPERHALGRYRLAVLTIEASGQGEAGRAALRALADEAPGRVAADKAVRYLAHDPGAEPRTTAAFLGELAARHADTLVADNARWWQAYVRLVRLNDVAGARASLRALVERWPDSPLVDDALWVLADLYRRQGAFDRAVGAYEALLGIRNETSLLVGSYRSRRLDDAALRVGDLHLWARGDAPAAARAYRRCLADFDTSVVRDDCWWGLAAARHAADDATGARAALEALLRERPDSRRAAAARAALAGDSTPLTTPAASPREPAYEVRWP